MDRSVRIVLLCLCVVLTAGICVHFGTTYDRNWPHPTGEQLGQNPDGWDGQQVLLFGEVREVTSDGLVMTVEDDSGAVARTVTVRGADVEVVEGGAVQVYGELSERGTVQQAEAVVVVNRSPTDSQYKRLTSLFGGILAAGLFLRYWRIDWRRLRFVTRESTDSDRRRSGDSDG